jgi:nucleoside-diphosphate-sugar epimerase
VNLFVFGLGFSAGYFAKRSNDRVSGTVRSQEKAAVLSASGITAHVFGPDVRDSAIAEDIAKADALLISVPPGTSGDPVLAAYAHQIASAPNLRWIGYLSTIGVYGDHQGAWVDEQTPATPTNARSVERAQAEQAWLAFGAANNIAVHIFRLAGIYGPGQNQLVQLARARQSGSSSRGRCSTASMSRILRARWMPRWRSRVPAQSTTSPIMSQRRRRMW